MSSEPANREDVRRELGELDPTTVRRILALGPTVVNLVDARNLLRDTDHLGPQPSLGVVVEQLVALLRGARRRELDDESASDD